MKPVFTFMKSSKIRFAANVVESNLRAVWYGLMPRGNMRRKRSFWRKRKPNCEYRLNIPRIDNSEKFFQNIQTVRCKRIWISFRTNCTGFLTHIFRLKMKKKGNLLFTWSRSASTLQGGKSFDQKTCRGEVLTRY